MLSLLLFGIFPMLVRMIDSRMLEGSYVCRMDLLKGCAYLLLLTGARGTPGTVDVGRTGLRVWDRR